MNKHPSVSYFVIIPMIAPMPEIFKYIRRITAKSVIACVSMLQVHTYLNNIIIRNIIKSINQHQSKRFSTSENLICFN